MRPAAFGVFEFFEHDHGGALAQDKAVAQAVERPRRALRLVVARRQRRQQIEAGHTERMDHAVRPARNHRVRVAAADDLRRLAHRLAARRTGRQAIHVRALRAEHGRDVARRYARFLLQFPHRTQRGQSGADELRHVQRVGFECGGHHPAERQEVLVAFPGTQVHAQPNRVESRVENARRSDRLLGGPDRELGVPPALGPTLGIVHHFGKVPVLDLGRDPRGKTARVENRRVPNSRTGFLQAVPHRLDVMPHRVDDTDACDDHTSSHRHVHLSLRGGLRRPV